MLNERPAGNARAGWSVVVGLLCVVTMPLAVAGTRWSERYELLHAALAIPLGLALGLGALLLARPPGARHERTLGRAGGLRAAAWGWALGIAGMAIASAAAIAVGVYGLLRYLDDGLTRAGPRASSTLPRMFEIGSSLREARTRQGLELAELETRTKIRAKYLRALEADQFEVLPGHTYVKGFLRTYADSLGLDGQLYVDEYNSRYVPGEDESAPLHPGARRSRRPASPPRAARVARRRDRARRDRTGRRAGDRCLEVRRARAERVRGLDTAGAGPPEVAPGSPGDRRDQGGARRLVHGGSRGDRAGRPLYRGTLERGQLQRFPRQRSVYISLGSPDNVVVKLNGNRVAFPNGGEAIVTARGLRDPRR